MQHNFKFFKSFLQSDQNISHQMSGNQQTEQQQQEQSQEIAIEDLQLQLQVYELQGEQKLKKLKEMFDQKGAVDPSKMFYEDRSSLQVKFQNIIGDLKEFLIKQEVAATEKLRRVFFRILDSPMLLLFKVSRFEIFQIRFDGFDIELQPMQAIQQLAQSIYKNIEDYLTLYRDLCSIESVTKQRQNTDAQQQVMQTSTSISHGQLVNKQFKSYQQFLSEASLNSLRDKIFILYSYLRKGANILKKKFENKVKIAEIFNRIDSKLTGNLIQTAEWKVLKQLSVLNYQIYLMQNGFDVLCFYLKVPMVKGAQEVFKDLQNIAQKAKQNRNFDSFILIFVKHHKQIFEKIRHQGIDQCYYLYVENTLMSILQLWGCRLCLYKQFTNLFELLFNLYKPHHKSLQICLKHTPSLEKDDIVLLITNFKLQLQQKHSQLLSLMTKRTLEEINRFLSELYHNNLYTLDFRNLKNAEGDSSLNIILNLVTLLNGDSSYEEFFKIFERSFRQWNHTIDLQHGHKLIPGEFCYPEIGQTSNQDTITDSIKIIRNFCVLQDMSFNKQYETLIKGGSNIAKTFLEFIQYLNKAALQDKNQRVISVLQKKQTQQMIIQVLNFLIRCGCSTSSANYAGSQNQSEKICEIFSKMICFMKQQEAKVKLSKSIKQIINKHYESIHITKCIEIFKLLQEKIADEKSTNIELINIMMLGTAKANHLFSYFKFFDTKVSSVEDCLQISDSQAQFLNKQALIKDGLIQPKNLGIFKLCEFQIVTNPIQFDKILDNIFFTLDSNAKRFVQLLVQQWFKETGNNGENFYSDCIACLLKQYPISIPLFCCTRVQKGQGQNKKDEYSLRCIELACHRLGSESENVLNILKTIVSTRSVRYVNGGNYIRQEINPMAMKQLIQILNKISQNVNQENQIKVVQTCELLAYVLQNSNIDNLKLQTISKIINKVKFLIYSNSSNKNCFSSHGLEKMASSYFKIVHIFFEKKEKDMRMPHGSLNFKNFLWNQIRSYNPSLSSQKKRPEKLQDPIIADQTLVSPFSISQQYNFQTFKISKRSQLVSSQVSEQKNSKKLVQVIGKLQNKTTQKIVNGSTFASNNQIQKAKQIKIANLKYNLRFHLGEQNIRVLEQKQNMRIIQQNTVNQYNLSKNNTEQNVSIIQYYLKELQIPIIQNSVVLECIVRLLESEKNQIQQESLYLWVNCKNYESIFANLMSIYEYTGFIIKKQGKGGITNKTCLINRIETKIEQCPQEVMQKILNFLGKIGYSDVWCENSKNLEDHLLEQLKQLYNRKGFNISSEIQYLAVLLKTSLSNDSLQKHISQSLDKFLYGLFRTRPSCQTSLMYKVTIDRELLNLIMKSLSIKNLNQISFLIHSNFNNLRLYTDQLHEGLKALNMASKNRSYNQYIQISGKQYEDQEFTGPMKLFKENFQFWIRIEKQGYSFKREQQRKLTLQRLANTCRKHQTQSNSNQLCQEINKIMDQYFSQINKLQTNIANRVKAFYLVTKLRDLSYQNANTIGALNSVLKKHSFTTDQILQAIDRIQLFTLMNTLHKDLVQFDRDWSDFAVYEGRKGSSALYTQMDDYFLQHMVTICSTRRFSHSMSKVYESCDLQFDQVLQRCYDSMKLFFTTEQGAQFIKRKQNLLFPAFLTRSFINDSGISKKFGQRIKNGLIQISKSHSQKYQIQVTSTENLISQLLKGFRSAPRETFYNPKQFTILVEGKQHSIQQVLNRVRQHMVRTQTFQTTKESAYLIFNKYKTSQATLEEVEVLGYIIAYCIFNGVSVNLPLHPSITAALSFNIANIDDLLSIQFKVWEELKSVLSSSDSKALNLNFSHIFNSLKTLQDQRVQLIDKGSSKKVNNFNRDQYVDLVACYLFYKNCESQIHRLLKTLITIVPKDYVSCLRIGQIHSLFYTKNNLNQLKIVSRNLSQKIGIVLPEVIIQENQTIENLKDFQNFNWLTEILLDQKNSELREKYWKQESNLFIVTCMGKKPEITFKNQIAIIRHFDSKQQLQKSLKQ